MPTFLAMLDHKMVPFLTQKVVCNGMGLGACWGCWANPLFFNIVLIVF